METGLHVPGPQDRRTDEHRQLSRDICASLCAAAKIFELVVIGPIFAHCQQALVDQQHEFLPERSTITNLLCFTGYVLDSFFERSQTDAIYTDLSAAFDKINHDIAIAKLDRLGINGNLLRWLESFISGRTLNIKIGGEVSRPFPATSGIAQDSHLWPFVFLFYFNDVNHSLTGPRLAFADDLKLFLKVDSRNDALCLQQQLQIFASWCNVNRVTLNPTKCSVMTFSRKLQPQHFDYCLDGVSIPRVEPVKDLGVIPDGKLDFKQHVSLVVTKAFR